MRFLTRNLILLLITCASTYLFGQDSATADQLISLPSSYYDKLSKKINGLEQQFDKKTEKYLQKIARQEQKLYRKLYKKDSAKAKELFGDIENKYGNLQTEAKERAEKLSSFSRVYSSKLDSLSTAFKFLENNNLVNPELKDKVQQSLGAINGLQGRLDQTEQIRKFLKERKKLLTEQLEKFGMVKELKQFKRRMFYYEQQIKEYKDLLNNPAKLEEKLLGLLVKIPAFRDFFSKNSTLASLFRLPGGPFPASPPNGGGGAGGGLAGLQTRASVMQDLQNRFGAAALSPSGGVGGGLQQNIQQAQDQLNQLRNQVSQRLGSGSSDDEIPSFRPNNQKTKNFWQRIELGTNFQSQRSNGLWPTTSDIGLSVGYKLNDKSIIGIGGSYKMGWGRNIQNIRITHQGVSARSFIDWKAPFGSPKGGMLGGWFISGGYEINYRPELQGIQLPSPLRGEGPGVRSQSGLIGISKVVSFSSPKGGDRGGLFKKTKVSLLYDFMANQQVPRAQPVVFRIGYSFK